MHKRTRVDPVVKLKGETVDPFFAHWPMIPVSKHVGIDKEINKWAIKVVAATKKSQITGLVGAPFRLPRR